MPCKRQSTNQKFQSLKSRSLVVDDKQPVLSKLFSSKQKSKGSGSYFQTTKSEVGTVSGDEDIVNDTSLSGERNTNTASGKRSSEFGMSSSPKRLKPSASKSELILDTSTETGESEFVRRTKEKLHSFSASDGNDQSGSKDAHLFDFTKLKSRFSKSVLDISDEIKVPDENTESGNKFLSKDNEDSAIDLTDDSGDICDSSPSTSTRLDKFSSKKQPVNGTKNKRVTTKKSTAVKYTPLEQQVVEFKDKYKDTILLIECGYKFRFFGQDAEIASKVLKIFAYHDHNFLTACIPVPRLFTHVRRLVSAGYKVGVVRQTETAALKAASSNKNTPFTRQLTALYTKSTLIGEDVEQTPSGSSDDTCASVVSASPGYLMCIYEQDPPKGEKGTQIGLVAVQPSTGDVIYDIFLDTSQRSELETRLFHLQPVEVIVPGDVSMVTQKLLNGIQTVSTHGDDRMRIERMNSDIFLYRNAFSKVSQFFKDHTDAKAVQFVINLPQCVICCLGALVSYLEDFKLEKSLTEVGVFSQFTTSASYMQLDSCTLRNLEIFHNATDFGEQGSLYSVLNQTVTPGGSRLLKAWLSKPLLSHRDILQRQDAISDIIEGKFGDIQKLRTTVSRLPDLERKLAAAYHQKCGPADFSSMCEALLTVCEKFQHQREAASCHVTSELLLGILEDIPTLLSDVKDILDAIDGKAAKANDKAAMFVDETAFPAVCECKERIQLITQEIQEHRRYVRLTTKQPALEYTTVLGTEFLIEVRNSNLSFVPKDWSKISSTKAVSRFHSPFIVEKYKLLQQAREQLQIESSKAWIQFLDEFSSRYQRYRQAVRHLSTLDCLMSLAVVAQQYEYTRPLLVEDEMCIDVEGGRHPVVQQLMEDGRQYVANDTHLSENGEHVMVVTGPNMGGKSCYIRQVALICILAQTGSYVPAKSARLGLLDAVFTRMGAADDIYKGRSTFMVELQEASEIMAKATSRSLVILDELGRGTSTHDGVAIAHATLDFFIKQPKCLTLFVTHYPSLAEFESRYPEAVGNFHMAFLLHDEVSDSEDENQLTFLYELVKGVAGRSYGLNVARLANIPDCIIKRASKKSREMENNEVHHRRRHELFQKLYMYRDGPSLKRCIEEII